MFVVMVDFPMGKSIEEGQTRRRNWFGLPVEVGGGQAAGKTMSLMNLKFMTSIKKRLRREGGNHKSLTIGKVRRSVEACLVIGRMNTSI